MELRVVFTRYKPSFISRAIMWFTHKREHPERDCSHVFWKFRPDGAFGRTWAAFEAMERGVWLNFYHKALGKQTIVAEFNVKAAQPYVEILSHWMLHEFLGENYDYAGIGLWAEWILLNRWFGSLVRWFHLKFRPAKVRQLFCSGLIVAGLKRLTELEPVDWGVDTLEPRTSTPRQMLDLFVAMPERYEYLGGVLQRVKE